MSLGIFLLHSPPPTFSAISWQPRPVFFQEQELCLTKVPSHFWFLESSSFGSFLRLRHPLWLKGVGKQSFHQLLKWQLIEVWMAVEKYCVTCLLSRWDMRLGVFEVLVFSYKTCANWRSHKYLLNNIEFYVMFLCLLILFYESPLGKSWAQGGLRVLTSNALHSVAFQRFSPAVEGMSIFN